MKFIFLYFIDLALAGNRISLRAFAYFYFYPCRYCCCCAANAAVVFLCIRSGCSISNRAIHFYLASQWCLDDYFHRLYSSLYFSALFFFFLFLLISSHQFLVWCVFAFGHHIQHSMTLFCVCECWYVCVCVCMSWSTRIIIIHFEWCVHARACVCVFVHLCVLVGGQLAI